MTFDNRILYVAAAVALSALLAFQCTTNKKTVEKYEESKKRYEATIQQLQESNSFLSESSAAEIKVISSAYQEKISSLTKERDSLKKKTYKEKLKIVKPDGSVVEKEIEKEDTESTREVVSEIRSEYQKQVDQIENKWKEEYTKKVTEIKQSYEKQLADERSKSKSKETESTTSTKTERKLRVEAGVQTDKQFYGHTSYSLSPFVLGGGISADKERVGAARFGLGLEF